MSNDTRLREQLFTATYDLVLARRLPAKKNPAAHQQESLRDLANWYGKEQSPKGGILALPTGAGKTFTAIRFLCSGPLSDNYKVLWLAHTHHLLEQAFKGFGPSTEDEAESVGFEVANIREPRRSLQVRVVSNAIGHSKVSEVNSADDVVIGTLQTFARAFEDKKQQGLHAFLKSAGGKLVIIFDEAHHAPAPTFRKLMLSLQKEYPHSISLGLTATPTYSDEKKIGWMTKVFPQGIVHQSTARKLMADKVLAKPIQEDPVTQFTPEFDEREYGMWVDTYKDLPQDIIEQLAGSRERNAMIVDRYVLNKERYGKTIMFADRWYQCDQLREMLRKRDVRADVIYSHVDHDPGSANKRNARDRSENAKILGDFRAGKLDVLINVRMLTEGTDVPDIQTVFLTRQTTSSILITQMIGRALRGPKFGGTENAYIVSFIDNWKQKITWAEFDLVAGGYIEEDEKVKQQRPPMQLISIELVRQLARMLDQGSVAMEIPFKSLMPVGWYRCEYLTTIGESEDIEPARELLMVMEDDQERFRDCIAAMIKTRADDDASEDLSITKVEARLANLETQYFSTTGDRLGGSVQRDLFHILRHIGQHGQAPQFFRFEEREAHDLDALATEFSLTRRLDAFAIDESLRAEYESKARFWNMFYYNYNLFKSQYDACVNGLIARRNQSGEKTPKLRVIRTHERVEDREPSDELKAQIKRRDRNTCLCCGEDNTRLLQIDHIAPAYYGGNNSVENLQTLCGFCNRLKSTNELNFTTHVTLLTESPDALPRYAAPEAARDAAEWEKFLRRTINTFYRSAAVEQVHIGSRGTKYYNWEITLFAGNPPAWLQPFGDELLRQINVIRSEQGVAEIESLQLLAPGNPTIELR